MNHWKFEEGDLYLGDCLKILASLPEASVDLVIASPPYENARTYGIDFALEGQDWVNWMVEVFAACLRVCKGMVAMVIGHGKQEDYKWSATPALLCADLYRKGVCLRNPKWFHRVGIPGSGGRDDLRKDVEWIVCATRERGELPWSDNTACGHAPKYGPGGEMSNRTKSGRRMNQWGHSLNSGATVVDEGGVVRSKGRRPSHKQTTGGQPEAIANPGDLIHAEVGGGLMGSNIAHSNEAPYPDKLPNFFIRTWCPPCICTSCGNVVKQLTTQTEEPARVPKMRTHDREESLCSSCGADLQKPGATRIGVVLDCFSGSGTTVAEAIKTGRKFIGIDVRESQIELTKRRIKQARKQKGFGL